MKVLLGIYTPDSGEIIFKGEEIRHNSPQEALQLGISMIHQELSLVPHRSVAENIFIGREPKTRIGLLNWKELNRKAAELMNSIGIEFDPEELVSRLTVSQQQMIEIARAISYQSDIIIMDEPTSALTDNEVEKLFSIIRDLKKRDVSVIFISHKLEEIFRIADRTTVLRDGQFIGVRDNRDFDKNRLIGMMVGRELKQIFPKEEVPIGEVVLEARNLTRKGVFENISFSVREGEILGFSGLMGSGRTEVMRALFGIDKLDSGEIFYNGQKVSVNAPQTAISMGWGMVTEDRKEEGLCLVRSVKENISMASMDNYCSSNFITRKKETSHAKKMIDMLRIKTPNHMVTANSLSGGNQQKVVIAKWLSTAPKLIILDEPTRGIDVGAKSEIHKLMTSFARKGLAVIMVSSEMPEILGMSDRIIVMFNGQLKGEFSREEASQEKIMKCSIIE
jgi:inositol transport system ATP-binding protein